MLKKIDLKVILILVDIIIKKLNYLIEEIKSNFLIKENKIKLL